MLTLPASGAWRPPHSLGIRCQSSGSVLWWAPVAEIVLILEQPFEAVHRGFHLQVHQVRSSLDALALVLQLSRRALSSDKNSVRTGQAAGHLPMWTSPAAVDEAGHVQN